MRLLFIFLLPQLCVIQGYNFTDITAYGYEQYQDIIINTELIKKASGKHQCSVRYDLLKDKLLHKYKRPFTMLDLGASQGYYSFRYKPFS